jgi:hypothetical protein
MLSFAVVTPWAASSGNSAGAVGWLNANFEEVE